MKLSDKIGAFCKNEDLGYDFYTVLFKEWRDEAKKLEQRLGD